jgi:hypothetical protein
LSNVRWFVPRRRLHDLRRVIGTTAMQNPLKNHATAHRYGISTTAAAQAAASVNLSSFWTTHRIDG